MEAFLLEMAKFSCLGGEQVAVSLFCFRRRFCPRNSHHAEQPQQGTPFQRAHQRTSTIVSSRGRRQRTIILLGKTNRKTADMELKLDTPIVVSGSMAGNVSIVAATESSIDRFAPQRCVSSIDCRSNNGVIDRLSLQ